ncbi:Vitamin B12 import ATP-binding protein BtuD [Terrisporobacter petrolearius]|uniref:Vitamin B12 import ATP-binding protein BtuD n=1 Tax=Terrisporobacter petrolearius TaxID=1460447 RepID=A0ABZ3FCE0_9FIRM
MTEAVIKIEDLHKKYRLGAIGGGTLTADLQSWWSKVRGKEDPNTKIGTKVYGKNETFMALNGINLEINKGDTIGIIGGNGAGKSTLLKILSRVTAPTKGKLKIKGRISSLLEVGTGFHPELTGRENVYLSGAILGMSKEEVDCKIEDIIEFSECRQFIDTPVKRYSSGMFVKLAFSVAAHLDSEILIMDEVLAVGDMKFQKKCINKMLDVAHCGRTILYVSHNMQTIEQLCNRVVVLEKGTVKYDGDVETGVSIYLNNKCEGSSIYNDLYKKQREAYLPKIQQAKFNYLELVDKENNVFLDSEKFRCIINWKNYDDIHYVQLRFEIRTIDDTPVAASVSSNRFSCYKNTETTYEVELDISRLATGKYQLLVVLCEVGDLGGYRDFDCVYPACVFEVNNSKSNDYTFEWNKRAWGHIQLNDLKMIEYEN